MKISIWCLGLALLAANISGYSQQVSYPSFGKGITFIPKDSSASIKMSARIQNLLVVDQPLSGIGTKDINGMVRRARLKFDGFAFSPKLKYKIELGLSNRDISPSSDAALVGSASRIVFDAVLKYEVVKGTSIWFGQTKLPGNRERVISSQKLQLVDRSLVNSRFNIDRDFGFQIRNKFSLGDFVIKPIASVSLGDGRNVITTNRGGFNYTGRIEFLPMGEFTSKGDYFSSDLKREETPKLSIGISGDYNDGTVRQGGQLGKLMIDSTGNLVEGTLITAFADLMFKYKGFSILAEAAYRESDDPTFTDASGNAYRQGYGYSGQAGYLFENNVEVAGRYTRVAPNKGSVSSIANTEQYTLGLSKYFIGHNLKLQTDLTYERNPNLTFATGNLIYRFQTELSF